MDYLKHPTAKAISRDVLEDPYELSGYAKMVAAKRLLLSGGGLLAQREAALETVLGYFLAEGGKVAAAPEQGQRDDGLTVHPATESPLPNGEV